MRRDTLLWGCGLLGLASCQTPPGYPPTTHRPLEVTYGNLTIRTDELVSQTETTSEPSISLPYPCRDRRSLYMLLMFDLSLPTENLPSNLTYAHTVHGIEPNRSTYLHWFQGNLTHSRNHNSFTPLPGTLAIAPYVSPSPNPGDIPHTYAFYLFKQPRGFVLEGVNAGRDMEATESYDRIGFSVQEVARQRGVELVAGTYLREQTPADENVR